MIAKDANNIRNRWRRYRNARIAYNFNYQSFREWAVLWGKNPLAYAAAPYSPNFEVAIKAPPYVWNN